MNIIKISTENAEYQIINSLKTNRVKRSKLNEAFIEGTECIKQAINAGWEATRIIIADRNRLSDWGKNIINTVQNAKIIEMSEKLFDDLSDKSSPSEMLMTIKIKRYSTGDIDAKQPFIIVMDRPGDCGNLGSIIRSANAFNADGVLIVGHGVDLYDSKTIRSSLGSLFFTKTALPESMDELLNFISEQKQKNNIEIIGTDSTGDVSLGEYRIKRPVMLVIGNEAKGMSVKLQEVCDRIIRIPMKGNVNSLNVSCAASILMWEAFKS